MPLDIAVNRVINNGIFSERQGKGLDTKRIFVAIENHCLDVFPVGVEIAQAIQIKQNLFIMPMGKFLCFGELVDFQKFAGAVVLFIPVKVY